MMRIRRCAADAESRHLRRDMLVHRRLGIEGLTLGRTAPYCGPAARRRCPTPSTVSAPIARGAQE